MFATNLGLQPALQEVLDLQTKNVIELHAVVSQDSGPHLRKEVETRESENRNIYE